MNDQLKDMTDRILAAADLVQRCDDDLLKAIAMVAATGNIQLVEMQPLFGHKPVIMMPPHMYNRMLELFPPKPQS